MYYRAVIFTSDIVLICGISDSSARRLLRRIRKEFDKKPNHFVTVEEFCFSTGIAKEVVYEHFDALGENRDLG